MKLKNKIKRMYNVADVEVNYNYWFNKILNLLLTMFDYENIDSELAREIELNLLLTGHAVVFEKNKEMQCVQANLYDFNKFLNSNKAVYANPILKGGKLTNNVDSIFIFNDNLQDKYLGIQGDAGLLTFISHYARQLADISSSINIYIVNTRRTSYPVAQSEGVRQSIIDFFNNLTLGKRAVITDDKVLNAFKSVDINNSNRSDNIISLLDARDRILEMMYRDIGIKLNRPKRAQVNSEEVNVDNNLLLINTNDLLKNRKIGIEKVNKMFNTNIRVSLNKYFNNVENGGAENDN
jgi:hypothetical protein